MVGELKVAFNKQLADSTRDNAIMVFFLEERTDAETLKAKIQTQKFIIDMTGNLDDQFDHLSDTWDLVSLPSEHRSLPILKRKK